jgi:hypothetical protein
LGVEDAVEQFADGRGRGVEREGVNGGGERLVECALRERLGGA